MSEYVDNVRKEIEITDSRVFLKGSNPFGEITNAYVDIRGRVCSPKEELKYVQVGDNEIDARKTLRLGDKYLVDIEPDFAVKETLSCTGSLDIPISFLLVGSILERPEYRRETHTELRKQKERRADNLQVPLGDGNGNHQLLELLGQVGSKSDIDSAAVGATELEPEGERLAYGLLIHPAKIPGEYYRVGTFWSEFEGSGGLAFFDNCEMRTIRLV